MSTVEQSSPVVSQTVQTLEAAARCRSCGALADGAYCAACGHPRSERLTLPGLFRRTLRKIRDLDFSIVRTLTGLLHRPGELIREYVAGRRAPYINPLGYALLTVTAFVAVDSALSTGMSYFFDPVLWYGWLSPYLGIVAVIPAALIPRWLFPRRDLTHAETMAFVLYTGAQIVLLETLLVAVNNWANLSWLWIPGALLEAGYMAWALTRFLDDRKVTVWLRGLLIYALMAAGVVVPMYLLVRNIFSGLDG